ncbi:MAG TPA: acyl-CoA dehydrogenase family protein, partial [Miltoncostaeaceae bacterium]|nr:acyl-CoA dehydrogenase family protein [Miltoncostaeaceae bacterium]
MNLELSDTHREVQALAREFAAREVAPHAAEWNADHHVPIATLKALGELGLLGLTVPEQYGGPGLDATALCLVMEELAAADAGVSVAVAVQNGLVASPLLRAGSEEQKQRWLPAIASGETIGCYALTEPDVGSDTAALRTSATADGDGWSLNGSKQWITNGGIADLFIIFARTGGPGARGVSAFVSERAPGLGVGREIPKMGLHSSSTVELAFNDLRVGPDQMLGNEGEGLKLALATLDGGRITVAAQACGIARAALDLAVEYAGERQAFGGPIARFQGVHFPIADIAAQIDAARLLTLHAAALRDAGQPHGEAGAKAKLFASSVAVRAADVAVQTLGGY